MGRDRSGGRKANKLVLRAIKQTLLMANCPKRFQLQSDTLICFWVSPLTQRLALVGVVGMSGL